MEHTPAIGIDLGTTYSCVAVYQHGSVEIIPNDQGNRTTPSYVAFTGSGRLIGDSAKNQEILNPKNTVFDAKRLIGRRFKDPSLKKAMKFLPFKVVDHQGKPKIQVQFKGEMKTFYPEEISAMVLGKMKDEAEAYLKTTIKNAVITVPAHFDDSQRQATKDAGEIAGLRVMRIINEPTAAAIAYGLDKKGPGEKNVLIFDFGGGTLDVSIVGIEDGVFDVKSTAGDPHLGGEDIVDGLVDHFITEFKRKHKKNLMTSQRAIRKLRGACERAKRALSSATVASIEIDCLFEDVDFNSKITRGCFEDLWKDLVPSILEPVETALREAKMDKSSVDEVVLVGGSSRIPKIQKLLQEFFVDKRLNKSINPDEAVAYGAAIQAAFLDGEQSDQLSNLLLLDVTPLSLGIETHGRIMDIVVKRGTKIPTKHTEIFTTVEDDQSCIEFNVYQGERAITKQNKFLGKFELWGIPPAPKGIPNIEVTFDIDVNGILNVSAIDKLTGRESKMRITENEGRLSKAEVERMIEEARKYKAEDMKQIDTMRARITLEQYAFRLKRNVDDIGERMKADDREELEGIIEGTIRWLDEHQSGEKSDYERKFKELSQVSRPIIASSYRIYESGESQSSETNFCQSQRPITGGGRKRTFEQFDSGYFESSQES